jgi:hypothetical protein
MILLGFTVLDCKRWVYIICNLNEKINAFVCGIFILCISGYVYEPILSQTNGKGK